MTGDPRQLDLFDRPTPAPAPPPAPRPAAQPLPDLAPLAERARTLARQLGLPTLARSIMVRWKPSLRTTAGQAHAATQILYLNPRVAAFGADEIERTFLHELAHLVAHARHGRRRIRAHGPEWRQACADLGIPGETATHALPIPRRQVAKPFAYRCPACATILRRTRPIRGKAACAACCRRHNRGRYDDRFRLARLAQP